MKAGDYPPSAFFFRVVFAGNDSSDTSFQDVSGIGAEMDTEDLVEGGENRFVHRLPKGIKHPKLVLKRGIAEMDSPLVKWCMAILDGEFIQPIETKTIDIHLLNEKNEPLRAWSLTNAYPLNWEIENFNSTKNEVAIEKIELSYNSSNRVS